jgi:protein required for attachment to host cells
VLPFAPLLQPAAEKRKATGTRQRSNALATMTKSKITLPQNSWVIVADGQRALFLRNDGDEVYPNLRTDTVLEHDNPPTREQGTDRPGRLADTPDQHRSALAETDWHQVEQEKFLGGVADLLKEGVHSGRYGKIVLVAPPEALGILRKALDRQVLEHVIAEVGKDLTRQPLSDIEKALSR